MLRKGDLPAVLQTVSFASLDDKNSDLPTFTDQTVQSYIDKYVHLHDEEKTAANKLYAAYGGAPGKLSPLQITMILSGCYGQSNFSLTWLKSHEGWINEVVAMQQYNWLLPVALQMLQTSALSFTNDGAIDGGMCSCLLDFAAPNIMMVMADSKAEQNTRYQYDTCLAQNLQDYTMNGHDAATANDEDDNARDIAFGNYADASVATFATVQKRNRADPLLTEYTSFFAAKSGNVATDSTFVKAMTALCHLDSMHTLFADGFDCNSAVSTKTYAEFQQMFDVVSEDKGFIQTMHAWNKARPPLLKEARNSQVSPPEIMAEDYKVYIQTYQHAFAMCRHTAAPAYSTVTVSRVRVFDYMRLGQALLLLGALVGFMFWRSTTDCETGNEQNSDDTTTPEDDATPPKAGTQQLLMFLKMLAFFVELLILVSVCISLAMMTAQQDFASSGMGKTNDFNPDNISQISYTCLMNWVLTITWVFVVVLILLLTFLTVTSLRSADACLPFAPAQVAMDVCIIAGLANMAVGVVLQRGYGDENYVVGTFVLFVTVGLMQHISNIARICQQYFVSYDLVKNEGVALKHEHTIAWNRTANAVLVILLLVAFGTSASTSFNDWTADMLYTQQHMWFFIAYAVAIFCAYDAYHELHAKVRPTHLQTGGHATGKKLCDVVGQDIGKKMRGTAWILLVGSLLLHLHQYTAMCLSKEPYMDDVDGGSGFTACQPFGYLYGNTRFYDWG